MLQVTPDSAEDMAEESKENISSETITSGKKPAGAEGRAAGEAGLLDADSLQQVVLQSGALEVILDAVKATGTAAPQGEC